MLYYPHMYTESRGPSPEQMGITPERRPSADMRESTAELRIIELNRQKAEMLTAMGNIDVNNPAHAVRAQELQSKLDAINDALGKAANARDAAQNEQELRRLGGNA